MQLQLSGEPFLWTNDDTDDLQSFTGWAGELLDLYYSTAASYTYTRVMDTTKTRNGEIGNGKWRNDGRNLNIDQELQVLCGSNHASIVN